jgi:hypothetical protein
MTGRPVQQPGGAMAAHIVKSARTVIGAPHYHNHFVEQIERVVIAGPRNIAQVTHELPGRAKHALALGVEEFRVVVDPRGKTQLVFAHRFGGRTVVHGKLFELGKEGSSSFLKKRTKKPVNI